MYFSKVLINEIMIEEMNFNEMVHNEQILTYVAIIIGLLMVYGAFKLYKLVQKVKKQKGEMQKLVKEYEDFLNQRDIV